MNHRPIACSDALVLCMATSRSHRQKTVAYWENRLIVPISDLEANHEMPGVSLSVCLFVCLSVCELLYVKKNYCTNLRANFITDVSVGRKRKNRLNFESQQTQIRIWIYLKILQHCEMGHFSTVWLIALEQEAPLPWRAQRVRLWYKSKAHMRLPMSD